MHTPRQGRQDPHVIKLDQVPRWNEHDPAIGPDSLGTAGNGFHEASGEDHGSKRRSASVAEALPERAVLLASSPGKTEWPLDPLEATESLRSTKSTSAAGPSTSGETDVTDVIRTLSSFNDPLTLRPKKIKTGASEEAVAKFPVNADVNAKVFLWRGDPWNLEVDVVVNSTNEVSVSLALFKLTGLRPQGTLSEIFVFW